MAEFQLCESLPRNQYAYPSVTNHYDGSVTHNDRLATPFTLPYDGNFKLDNVSFHLEWHVDPGVSPHAGNVRVDLVSDIVPYTVLGSASIDRTTVVTGTSQLHTFDFSSSNLTLETGQQYWLVVYDEGGMNGSATDFREEDIILFAGLEEDSYFADPDTWVDSNSQFKSDEVSWSVVNKNLYAFIEGNLVADVGQAEDPTPTHDGTAKPDSDLTTSWTAPGYAGLTFKRIDYNYREEGSAWSTVLLTEVVSKSFGVPDPDTTYEWRVDYVFYSEDPGGPEQVYEGNVWNFTAEYAEISGTCGAVSSGFGNLPHHISGTSVSVSAAGTGAGGGSGVLTAFLDVYTSPSEINVTKTLYAIANNEFWYESSTGTMTELAAANGDMDISLPIQSTPAYQKVFIANKGNLRIADFINVRLTSESKISSNVPSHGDILTQDTTNATMTVDYIYYDTSASDHYVYGRQTSTASFNTSNDVKDADSNTIISSSDLTDVSDSPHWYTWTEYNKGEDTSYLGMPDAAQLMCLYRGRLVLAGDPNDPYQWYMSRQDDPWDWAYTASDAQAPIAGGNGTMGRAGDVIKALIPFHDDYLILGCSHTMMVMRGDPAAGGSLDVLDNSVGIFGPKSWTFDNEGNLYFYGTGGLYHASREIFQSGGGGIVNLSKSALPNL